MVKNSVVRVILLSLAYCSLITLFSPLISAQPAENKKTTYTIGVENVSYLPYYSAIRQNQKENLIGYIPELLNQFAQHNNIQFIYKTFPIKRLHRKYFIGELDLIYPDNPEWVADEKKSLTIFYSLPIVYVTDGVLVKPKNKGKPISNLGTLRGYTVPPYEKEISQGKIKLFEVNHFNSLLRMTIASRLDAAYVSINPGLHLLSNDLQNEQALIFDQSQPFERSAHSLSSQKYPELLIKLNLFIKNNGDFIHKLKEKYNIKEFDNNTLAKPISAISNALK